MMVHQYNCGVILLISLYNFHLTSVMEEACVPGMYAFNLFLHFLFFLICSPSSLLSLFHCSSHFCSSLLTLSSIFSILLLCIAPLPLSQTSATSPFLFSTFSPLLLPCVSTPSMMSRGNYLQRAIKVFFLSSLCMRCPGAPRSVL